MTTSLTAPAVPGPVTDRRLTLISLVLVLGALTTLLDTTIVNIALDHLHHTFHESVARTQWVATAYLLAFVSVIPVSGWVSERLGARTAWIVAVATFMVGSLLCGLAWSLPSLVVFRVLQGVGGGLVLPVTITILTRAAGRERIGRAIATIGLIGQLAPILGPIIGGSIVQSVSWHWLFFVNIPICLAALVLGPLFLPSAPAQRGSRFDVLGFVLLTPAVALIAYGVSRLTGDHGFAATDVWLPLGTGGALLVGFVASALRNRTHALVDVRVFARRSFGLSSVITFVGGFSMYALMFLLPLFYQQVRGASVLHTGLLLIPQGLGTMLFIVLSRRLTAKLDGRLVVGGGVVLLMLGIVPFALAGVDGHSVLLLVAQFVQGVGMGAASLPVMTLAFASLSHDETPRGSAAFSIVQRVGAPFGVTVVAVVLEHFLASAGSPAAAAGAFGATFWWVLGLSAVPLVLAAFLRRASR
ncbi:MDR family MFS transporter [Curtobacterium sp. MCBD17_040]|uniref:MDR family MFS transporter n=1 Tax=Curtobacterium sp. MCBD17_040 TaxID=2175674 RepID=UPI000DA7007C|nr:MDR family MFS transporter [Curtobacterium sp. MCBD17_040]WIB63545.1 MDR family MFS transporter [Curtobacterium sp. MCBD17_040]